MYKDENPGFGLQADSAIGKHRIQTKGETKRGAGLIKARTSRALAGGQFVFCLSSAFFECLPENVLGRGESYSARSGMRCKLNT
jgi:hypothetical protein